MSEKLPPGEYKLEIYEREIQVREDDNTVTERVKGIVKCEGVIYVVEYFHEIPPIYVTYTEQKNAKP